MIATAKPEKCRRRERVRSNFCEMPYLNLREAAAYLGIAYKTITQTKSKDYYMNWTKEGVTPSRLASGEIRIRRWQLDVMMKNRDLVRV